ncbi:flagellar assembly protein A [Pseudodesulfovibrio sp.]|uniref:flagellar assembly protein A n=1 Tax=unclassified Pseudodesulfovibrio TaxID=2661612 RepID=UPI003AFFB2A0
MAQQTQLIQTSDARFRFSLSEDGMKLGVNRYFPPCGGEGPSVALLKRQIAEAGVNLPVDEEAARQVVENLCCNGEIKRITLVHGIPPQEPRDGSLTALGELEYPVFPGDRFARLRKSVEAKNGRTIDGRILKPTANFTPQAIDVKPGDNVSFDTDGETLIAQVWGLARLRDGVLRVHPVAHMSEDAITITATVHDRDFRGDPITTDKLEKQLRDMGVVIDIDTDRLARRLKRAAQNDGELPDQEVAHGTHPIPGEDGWLEYLVSTRETAGTEDAQGRLDFRNRGCFPMVEPGQIIARMHRATPGEGGIDLFGKTIPANAGIDPTFHAGENVTRMEDGLTFQAKTHGVAVMEGNVLTITECMVINGNVDLVSGNVEMERGSIKIRGNILSGFRVSTPGHIFVGGSVESATVEAGGNIEVAGGILMAQGGKLVAGGGVTANFAINAVIRARGDVTIANEVTNSLIRAGGRFEATRGQGIVQGGAVIATRGLKVNEVGSDLGVPTTVGLQLEERVETEQERELFSLQEAMDKIDEALGSDSPETILARTCPDDFPAVTELIAHRQCLMERCSVIRKEINRMALERQAELAGRRIKVQRFLFPGATVKIGIRTLTFKTRTEASIIFWDQETRTIVTR